MTPMTRALWAITLATAAQAAVADPMAPPTRPQDLALPDEIVIEMVAAQVAAQALGPEVAAPRPAAEPQAPDDGPHCPEALPGQTLGPVTCRPVPRFVTLKSDEVNVRRGPSLSHRIDWVFLRDGMPLQITAEYGHWRRVVDHDGLGGWVHFTMLSGERSVIVDRDMQPLFARASEDSAEVALLESGVIADLDECSANWCHVSAGGYDGWLPKSAVWGVEADETLD